MISNMKIKKLIFTSIFAAIIYMTVAFLFHIPTGFNNGYIHLGDAFIYLAASILPRGYGMVAAGIGAGLADVLTGSVIWLIPTLIIKPTIVLAFTSESKKIICKRNIIALFLAGAIGIIGYYIAEAILYGNIVTPLLGVIPNMIQAIGSGIIFSIVGFSFDKINIKKRINL